MAATELTIWNIALSFVGGRRLSTTSDDVKEARLIDAVYDDIRDEVLMAHPWSFSQKRAALVDMTKPTDTDDWEAEEDYAVDDEVIHSALHYTCLVAHTSDMFSTDLSSAYWELTTDWATATDYYKGDQVYYSGVSYTCIVNHTSETWATDLNINTYWVVSEYPDFTEDGMVKVYYKPTDCLKVNMVSDASAVVKLEGNRILSNVGSLKIVYTYQNTDPSTYTSHFRIALGCRLAAAICFDLTNVTTKAKDLLEEYEGVLLPRAETMDSQQGTPTEMRQDEWENARQLGARTVVVREQTWHPI